MTFYVGYTTILQEDDTMLLFYVRHGHPIYKPDCLTEAGKQEAEALVTRMERVNPDRIFASTSTRAIQTAEPTAKKLGMEITTLDWCHENKAWAELTVKKDDGNPTWCFHHKPTAELLASAEIQCMGHEWYKHPFFENTKFKDGIDRIQHETDAFLEALGYRRQSHGVYTAVKPNDDRNALFAHQGFGLAFLSCVLGIPYPLFCTHFDITYTGMTVIEFKGDGTVIPRILQHSGDSHIFASGMDTVYNNTYTF